MQLPPWASIAAAITLFVAFSISAFLLPHPNWDEDISVAFIGNSAQFFNDLPRFMEALSGQHIMQNSCFRGSSTLTGFISRGNGMYNKFRSENAFDDDREIYDFGACTVKQLLLGHDDDLSQYVYSDDDGNNRDDDDNYYNPNDDDGVYDDGKNPCYNDKGYLEYTRTLLGASPSWDYVVLNDRFRNPGQSSKRQKGLEVLESTYIPWIAEAGATPVLLHTHAQPAAYQHTSSMVNVPIFTSLTYYGYQQYASLMESMLPEKNKPRIAPVGIAFLVVWEEDSSMWKKLFHTDHIHASPHGTFLQGCVLHFVLFGRMPFREIAIRDDVSFLWNRARRMQPRHESSLPMPTRDEAMYLYDIAEKVARFGYRPKSFVLIDPDHQN